LMADWNAPPFFFAAARYGLVAILLFPWLLRVPRQFWRVAVVAMLMQGVGFAIFIMGMRDATASAAGIVSQISVPATTMLSVLLLGERIRWKRALGVALALAGIVILMWRPEELQATWGLWLVAASALMSSVAVIVMKGMKDVSPLEHQAWSGLLSCVALGLVSAGFETGQVGVAMTLGWKFIAALLFMAVLVSIVSHSLFYWLNQTHDAGLIAPLMVMVPLFTVALGVWITGDVIDLRMAIGSAITLAGVLIILLRPNAMLPLASLFLNKSK
jgi:O-acetylserine/cysteine efflux transporter